MTDPHIEAWSDDIIRMCDDMNDPSGIPVSALLAMMTRFKDVYPSLFSHRRAVKTLDWDIQNGINVTRRAQARLRSHGTLTELVRLEIEYHNGDRSKCQDRRTSGIVAVTWLARVLWFVATILQVAVDDAHGDADCIGQAYTATLRKYHSWTTAQGFLLLKAMYGQNASVRGLVADAQMCRVMQALQVLYARIYTVLVRHGVHFEFKV